MLPRTPYKTNMTITQTILRSDVSATICIWGEPLGTRQNSTMPVLTVKPMLCPCVRHVSEGLGLDKLSSYSCAEQTVPLTPPKPDIGEYE
jgi:hypothetical protein